MPVPYEYKDICNMLLDATKQGRVNWFERGGSFVVRLPEFDFEIWSGTDEGNEMRFVAVGLKDPKGRGLLDDWFIEEGSREFEEVSELCDAARRYAHRVSQKLEQMRGLLQSGRRIGMDTSAPKGDEPA